MHLLQMQIQQMPVFPAVNTSHHPSHIVANCCDTSKCSSECELLPSSWQEAEKWPRFQIHMSPCWAMQQVTSA